MGKLKKVPPTEKKGKTKSRGQKKVDASGMSPHASVGFSVPSSLPPSLPPTMSPTSRRTTFSQYLPPLSRRCRSSSFAFKGRWAPIMQAAASFGPGHDSIEETTRRWYFRGRCHPSFFQPSFLVVLSTLLPRRLSLSSTLNIEVRYRLWPPLSQQQLCLQGKVSAGPASGSKPPFALTRETRRWRRWKGRYRGAIFLNETCTFTAPSLP